MKNDESDRRKFARLNILVDVTYSKHAAFKDDKLTFTKNISRGGMCFVGYEKLKLNDVVDLNVFLPGDSIPIIAIGKVVWVKEFNIGDTSKKRYDVGVEFVEVAEQDVRRIDKYMTGRNT
jgi:c-di-GMP-binding flagellar brake protein YcgR